MRDKAAATAGNPAVCDADAIERLPRHIRTSSGDDTPHGSPPQPRQGALPPPHDPAALLANAPPRIVPQPYTAASAADPPQRHRLAAWIPDSLPLRTTSVPAASLRAAAEEAEAADAQSQAAGLQARDCMTPEQPPPGGGPSGSWSYRDSTLLSYIAVILLQHRVEDMLHVAPAASKAATSSADVVCWALPLQQLVLPRLWRPHQRACPLQPGHLLCWPLRQPFRYFECCP